MNAKTLKIFRMIIFPLFFLVAGFYIYYYFPKNSKPYNISKEQRAQILDLINHDIPDFEKTAKKNIEFDKRIKDIFFGKYDWHIYKRNGNIYYALYGYFGHQKFNKFILDGFMNIINRRLNRPLNLSLCYFLLVDLDKKTIEGTEKIGSTHPIEINSDL
jgi:hypothetical protein